MPVPVIIVLSCSTFSLLFPRNQTVEQIFLSVDVSMNLLMCQSCQGAEQNMQGHAAQSGGADFEGLQRGSD